MIGGRRVGHLGHRVFFTALENILDTCGDIHLFVGSTDLTRRAVNNHIGHSKQITQATMAGVACLCKGCDSFLVIKGAIERVTFANRKIAPKCWARFGHAYDLHVVLSVHSIRNAFADCSVSIDGDFDGHDLLQLLLTEAVNKSCSPNEEGNRGKKHKLEGRAEQQSICVVDSTTAHGGCFRGRQAVDEHQRKIGPSPQGSC